jgi:hypothetical protein
MIELVLTVRHEDQQMALLERSEGDKEELVSGLEKLLECAKSGEIKGICFAGVDFNGDMTLGVLRRSACCIHELIGLSHILSDSLLESLRE